MDSLGTLIDNVEERGSEQQDILRNMKDLLEHQSLVEAKVASGWKNRMVALEQRAKVAETDAKQARVEKCLAIQVAHEEVVAAALRKAEATAAQQAAKNRQNKADETMTKYKARRKRELEAAQEKARADAEAASKTRGARGARACGCSARPRPPQPPPPAATPPR